MGFANTATAPTISGYSNSNQTARISTYPKLLFNIKGKLSSLVSGGLNLVFDRISIGDLIEYDNQIGHVTNISLYSTTIEVSSTRKIEIPNSLLDEKNMKNYGSKRNHRPDVSFNLKKDCNIDAARDIVVGIMKTSESLHPKNNVTNTVFVSTDKRDNLVLTAFSYSDNNDTWSSLWNLKDNMYRGLKQAGCI